MARVLVLFRAGPANPARVRDGLDLALAAIAFDHDVRVLFLGDGAALVRGDDAGLTANLRALAFHGAREIGVDASSAPADGGALEATLLDAGAQRAWIAESDQVFAC